MKTRILIIEDNMDNLELMTYLLKQYGYKTFCAINGEEGVVAIERETPNLVICDIQLPKLNGFEIAKQIKNDSRLKKIPLIAVTAYSMVGDRDKILAAGFDGYISKPIDPELFIKQIEQFLPIEKSANNQANFNKTFNYEIVEKTKTNLNTKGTILVLDDTLDIGELSRTLLESVGFEVILVSTAQKALGVLDTMKPDLILSDIHLPQMDGLEFLKCIKSNSKLNGIPFVFISSSATRKDKEDCFKLGAIKYILRPVEPALFLDIIQEVWSSSQKDTDMGE